MEQPTQTFSHLMITFMRVGTIRNGMLVPNKNSDFIDLQELKLAHAISTKSSSQESRQLIKQTQTKIALSHLQ
jgi:hypothetical protein